MSRLTPFHPDTILSNTRFGLLFGLLVALMRPAIADNVVFERDVRPILKAHCFQCHGEAGETEGGLDIRLRRLMAAGGDSGPAIIPGDPEKSLLLQRVRSGEMPPGDDKRLSDTELSTLSQWLREGARTARKEPETLGEEPLFTDEERAYWAFQPVSRPQIPVVADPKRVKTPVDAFLLTAQGTYTAPADRERLIRRAAFNLTGLPPKPADIDLFLNDESPEAWSRLVDRLLASPHYGERWGRHWLDVAGYADSEGYTDEDRVRMHAWRYRDYVIRSFNADKPFNEFIKEQLAGDELVPMPHENLSPDNIDRLTATGFLRMAPDGTGTVNQPAARNQVIADTLQIVGTSLLGLTVNCAQCHDHRYDPIPTSDYYRLRAVFEPAFDWKNWLTPQGRQTSLYTDADRTRAAEIEAEAAKVDSEREMKAAEYITRTLDEELELVPQEKRDPLRVAYRAAGKDRTAEQQALLKEYPSVAAISVGSLYLYDRRRDERARKLDDERKKQLAAALATATEKVGTPVTEQNLAAHAPETAKKLAELKQQADELRATKAAPDLKKYADRAAEIRDQKPEEGFLRTLREQPNRTPATFVFYRGDIEQPKQEVAPADLSILAGTREFPVNDAERPTTGRRLAFAQYLTSGKHPLVARVLVNRIWLHHFGRGLVDSPGDFGVLGNPPTHPRLLDWLASEFVESGWSVKHLHRLIMLSAAYQQSAADSASETPEKYVGFPVRRLESEIIRDAVLAVSGKLNPKQFGQPVPVMEDGVGRIVIGRENLDGERKPTKAISLEGEEFRRSIYIQVRRTRTLSMLATFDAATLNPNCEKRPVSTATPQSLLLMNSDFAVTYAGYFADRILKEANGDLSDAVILGWRLAYGIRPTDSETAAGRDFILTVRAGLETDGIAKDSSLAEATAVFCQALLSSNRFLYTE